MQPTPSSLEGSGPSPSHDPWNAHICLAWGGRLMGTLAQAELGKALWEPALCLAELPLPLQRAGVEALHGHAAAPPRAAVDAAEPAAPDQVRRRAARDGGELAGREHLSGRRGFRG